MLEYLTAPGRQGAAPGGEPAGRGVDGILDVGPVGELDGPGVLAAARIGDGQLAGPAAPVLAVDEQQGVGLHGLGAWVSGHSWLR